MKVYLQDISLDDHEALEEWYQIYAVAFPHAGEREPIEFFRSILIMNDNPKLQSAYGPYREYVMAIRDVVSGTMVGGLNFGVTTSPAHKQAGLAGSAHAVFLFIAPEYRGVVAGARVQILEEIKSRTLGAFPLGEGEPRETCILFEVNNPLDMTPDELLEDYANSGIDTYRRYHAWLNIGFPLDFSYVQPALSASQKPVTFLHLFYRGPRTDGAISAPMLFRHLYSFISISVLKGADAASNKEFEAMGAVLQSRTQIKFIPPGDPDLTSIVKQAEIRQRAQASSGGHKKALLAFPDTTSAFARPGWLRNQWILLKNALFAIGRSLYIRLEPWHIVIAYIEVFVLFCAFSISAMALVWKEAEAFKGMIEGADAFIFFFLFSYLATRLLVQRRRERLGSNLREIYRRMRRLDTAIAGGGEVAFEWLREQLLNGATQLSQSGDFLSPDLPNDVRSFRLRQLASYASPVFSERVLDREDRDFTDQEYNRLVKYLEGFNEGIWGAQFANCPNRYFFSLILPIIPPQAQRPLDLETLVIDTTRARLLAGRSRRGLIPSAGTAPCLLVLRQLESQAVKGKQDGLTLQRQCDLLLTSLLHLAAMLADLSHGGDIVGGLEAATVLCVATNRTNRLLLESFGFKLLLHTREGGDASHQEDDARFSLYTLGIDKGPRPREVQRLLELLAQLLKEQQRTASAKAG